jgi:hypothetical protein
VADEKPFDLPDLKDSIGFRLDDQAKKDIYILMASQRETRVSNIIKWALAQQAAPVRQSWQAAADRSTEEADG